MGSVRNPPHNYTATQPRWTGGIMLALRAQLGNVGNELLRENLMHYTRPPAWRHVRRGATLFGIMAKFITISVQDRPQQDQGTERWRGIRRVVAPRCVDLLQVSRHCIIDSTSRQFLFNIFRAKSHLITTPWQMIYSKPGSIFLVSAIAGKKPI